MSGLEPTTSHAFSVGRSPPRLALGGPLEAGQPLLARPNLPPFRLVSANPNRARQPGTAARAPSRSGPKLESAALTVVALLPSGSSLHPWHRRAIDELGYTMSPGMASQNPSSASAPVCIPSISPPPRGHLSLSLRGFINPLTYPIRRAILRDALRDAQGDRRLAFVLFSKWATAHTTVAGLPAIVWAFDKLAPAKTPSPDLSGQPTPEGMACSPPWGAGLVLPAPHKGGIL